VISWATSDGRERDGDRVVPAASTIKLFVVSAFWRSGLDHGEAVDVPPVPWSVADSLASATLGDCALLSLAFSDNAATNVLLARLGLDTVNAEAARLGCERRAGEPDLRSRPRARARRDRGRPRARAARSRSRLRAAAQARRPRRACEDGRALARGLP